MQDPTWQDPTWLGSLAYWLGSDAPQDVLDFCLWASGLSEYIYDLHWDEASHSYTGHMDPYVFDLIMQDPDFANGSLYAFHTSVGRDIWDFRSFNNYLDTGRSLQIVVDQYTGNFYADTDRFNPYQDVVSFLGHAFVEVLPGLLKKIF